MSVLPSNEKLFSMLWVEKYRPKSITDVALPSSLEQNVHTWLEKRQIPHLLFYGPAGSGKTTTALILANELASDIDQLIINGSYYRGIQDVRNQILPFVRQAPLDPTSSLRIVLIDEADSITGDAWKALRHIIEQYSKYARFIMTCNYIKKIPDPIISRMQCFEFNEYDLDFCKSIIESILISENVAYTEEQIEYVINRLYPDLRKMIHTIQMLTIEENGCKILDLKDIEQALPVEDQIVQLFSQFFTGQIDRKVFVKTVEEFVRKRWIDYSSLYQKIFDIIPEHLLEYRVLCNDYAYKHQNCISEDMNFLAFLYELTTGGYYRTQ